MRCGLVMNKDEIQPAHKNKNDYLCCGLVMNKDEIQLGPQQKNRPWVVVW